MRYPPPNPTADKAVDRASRTRHGRLPAARDQLEKRLQAAIARDDGRGVRALAYLIARCSG